MSITITITDPGSVPVHEMERICEYLERAARAGAQPVPAMERFNLLAPSAQPSAPLAPPVPHPHVPGLSVVVPPAPLPTPGATPGQGRAPDLDSRGYPWDARIHSDSKSKNANGTWRYRRGVKDDVIEPVELELRGVMGMGQTVLQEEDSAMIVPQEAEPIVPPAPTVQDVPPPPPAASNAPTTGDDFNHLANVATKALAAKTITQAQITAILNEVGEANGCVLPHLGALFTRKDLIPAVREKLQALIAGS